MTRRSVQRALRGGTALAIGVVLLASPMPTGAVTPVVRYAGPNGSGSVCTKPKPCNVIEAVALAPAGATVLLLPGTYGAQSALTAPIADTAMITIETQPGQKPATIKSSASPGAVVLDYGSTVRDLVVDNDADGGIVLNNGDADHLRVTTSSSTGQACSVIQGSVSDSLCAATGQFGYAVYDSVNDTGAAQDYFASVRGVTAVADGLEGQALDVGSAGSASVLLAATNSIFRDLGGYSPPVTALTYSAGAASVIDLAACDFSGAAGGSFADGNFPPGTIVTGSGNITAPPKFTDSAKGQFTEATGSPTINRGEADPMHGTDLAGEPRTVGKAPDMGAFEFLPKPRLTALKVARRTKHALTTQVTLNGEGTQTVVRIVIKHSGHVVRATKETKRYTGVTAIRVTSRGLKPHSSYTIDVTATNPGGTTTISRRANTAK
jgi:hypothetical protein